jgi:hypothetical protein
VSSHIDSCSLRGDQDQKDCQWHAPGHQRHGSAAKLSFHHTAIEALMHLLEDLVEAPVEALGFDPRNHMT